MKLFSENIYMLFFLDTLLTKLYNINVNKIKKVGNNMSSKKYRKKLKEQKNEKKPSKMFLKDSEQVINYLKTRPYEIVKGQEILDNTDLIYNSSGSLTQTIKSINYYTNNYIQTFKGKNGGFMYHVRQRTT